MCSAGLCLLRLGRQWHLVACVLGACPHRTHSEAGRPPSEGQDRREPTARRERFPRVNLANGPVTCAWTGSGPPTTESACGIPATPPLSWPRATASPLTAAGSRRVTWVHLEPLSSFKIAGLLCIGSQDHSHHPGCTAW